MAQLESASAHQALKFSQKIGLIDVGSGTVRLVVYGVTKNNEITSLFTDKAVCSLGESAALTGALSEDAQRCAIDSITRFQEEAKQQGVDCLHAFATSAVRKSKNKKAFLQAAKDETGVAIDLISGKKESKLQAIGSSIGNKHSKGRISLDQGRGSVDAAIIKTVPMEPKSGLLGSTEVMVKGDKALRYIKKEVKNFPDYPKGRKMHLVGGGWRRLAIAYLIEQGIERPKDVLHGYQVNVGEFLSFVDQLAKVKPERLQEHYRIEEARIAHIPANIEVLRQFASRYESTYFVFSMFGAREGYLLSEILNKKAKDVRVLPPPAPEALSLAAE